jgi:hypothetical protein
MPAHIRRLRAQPPRSGPPPSTALCGEMAASGLSLTAADGQILVAADTPQLSTVGRVGKSGATRVRRLTTGATAIKTAIIFSQRRPITADPAGRAEIKVEVKASITVRRGMAKFLKALGCKSSGGSNSSPSGIETPFGITRRTEIRSWAPIHFFFEPGISVG